MALDVGDTLGRYEIRGPLGTVGIGEVVNLTDEANWYDARNRVLVHQDGSTIEDFGEPDSVGDPRRFQLGARLRF